MTVEEINLLQHKAQSRKDGVYSFKGCYWVVKNNNFIAFSEHNGECYQRMGSFNVQIGIVKRYQVKAHLTQWLRKQHHQN